MAGKLAVMKRPRFTLRFLLAVVTIAAIGLWYLQATLLPLPISESQVKKVLIGCTQSQVRQRLGPPHDVYSDRPPTVWRYSVFGTLRGLYVEFDSEGRVASIQRLSYILRYPDE